MLGAEKEGPHIDVFRNSGANIRNLCEFTIDGLALLFIITNYILAKNYKL